MLLVELVSTVRTAMLRHSGAFASKVFATSRNGRFASKLCTLPKVAVGTYCRNSSAFCGCWTAHPARSAAAGASSFQFIVPPCSSSGSAPLCRPDRRRKGLRHIALESAVVDGAAAADLGRIVRGKACAEGVVGLVIPHVCDAVLHYVAEVQAIRRGDHAAGHRVAREAEVSAAPRPVATAWAALRDVRQTQGDPRLIGDTARLLEAAFDARGIDGEQRLGVDELAHRLVLLG